MTVRAALHTLLLSGATVVVYCQSTCDFSLSINSYPSVRRTGTVEDGWTPHPYYVAEIKRSLGADAEFVSDPNLEYIQIIRSHDMDTKFRTNNFMPSNQTRPQCYKRDHLELGDVVSLDVVLQNIGSGNVAEAPQGYLRQDSTITIKVGCPDTECTRWFGADQSDRNGNIFRVREDLGANGFIINPDPFYNYDISATATQNPVAGGHHMILTFNQPGYFSKTNTDLECSASRLDVPCHCDYGYYGTRLPYEDDDCEETVFGTILMEVIQQPEDYTTNLKAITFTSEEAGHQQDIRCTGDSNNADANGESNMRYIRYAPPPPPPPSPPPPETFSPCTSDDDDGGDSDGDGGDSDGDGGDSDGDGGDGSDGDGSDGNGNGSDNSDGDSGSGDGDSGNGDGESGSGVGRRRLDDDNDDGDGDGSDGDGNGDSDNGGGSDESDDCDDDSDGNGDGSDGNGDGSDGNGDGSDGNGDGSDGNGDGSSGNGNGSDSESGSGGDGSDDGGGDDDSNGDGASGSGDM